MLSSNLRLSKRFSHERPGLHLLGIEKAAVPVTVVAADILAQEAKPLPLLDEFVLRLVKADVAGTAEIAAFLGLEPKLIDATVADHYREGALLAGPALGQLRLTERGRRLADELESVRPIQKTVKIAFDRLTWSLADYESRDLVTKAAAQSEGCILLPAQRTTRIKKSDITPAAVNSFLRQPGRGASLDVLDVINVTPSTHRYMPVDILIYGDKDRGEVETAVVVDGDPSENHDTVLSTLGGADKLGFSVEPPRPHAPLPPHLEAGRVTTAPGTPQEENPPPVREIRLFDHQTVLATALETAEDRLLIGTDLATSSVVDSTFLAKLDQRLRARVQVDLILSRCDREAEKRLDVLARRHRSRIRVHQLESAVQNTLVFDGNWVVSDFPWLSFRGAGRPFRDYTGTVVTVPDEVDHKYATLLSLLAD
ncbi:MULTISPECIES: hypothetical protein [Nocardia]|uniref:hypothetical protein n=1 Tax=Nocardia TaxID=1817 RepID=UPI00157458E9|nr:hypothetical protein [Nocardia barduliensis]